MLKVAASPKASMRQRIEAERLAAHCAVAALQVTYAGPLMMRRLVRNLDISHFSSLSVLKKLTSRNHQSF
jgi:hypothetical protein